MRQSGFTLIEVLISVLVLALGVIGAAGMQLTALRTTQQSAFQTIALDLASEMAEKMRANTGQMKQLDDLNTFMNVNYKSGTDGNPSAPDKMCFEEAVNCNAKELAEFDVYEWETRIKAALPSGRVVICRDANPWMPAPVRSDGVAMARARHRAHRWSSRLAGRERTRMAAWSRTRTKNFRRVSQSPLSPTSNEARK